MASGRSLASMTSISSYLQSSSPFSNFRVRPLKSSIIPILGRPLGFLPIILPSVTIFNKMFPRTTCPIQFFFLFVIDCTKPLSSPTKASRPYFYIRFAVLPAHLLHPPPYPHFRPFHLVYYFLFHCPSLTSTQCCWPQ